MLIENNEVIDSKELFERYKAIHTRRLKAEEKWNEAKEQIDSLHCSLNFDESGIQYKSDNLSPTERKAIRLAEAKNKYVDAIYDDAFAGLEVFDLLELLEDVYSSSVLYWYFLDHNTMEKVAEIMGYQSKQIYRIKKKALKDFDEVLADIDGAKARHKAREDEFWEICARIEKASTQEVCD